MEVTWWNEVPSSMKQLQVDGYAGKENHLATTSGVQTSQNTRRPPLGELSHNQLNIQRSRTSRPVEANKVDTKKSSGKDPFQRTANISIRNERERNRVKLLNLGFERLRAVVPRHAGEQMSKISTLKKAIWYIEHLDRVLHGQDETAPQEAAAAPSTGSSGNSGCSQSVWTRDPRASLTCQQTMGHKDVGGPHGSCDREAGSLTPGTTSWTPLPLGPPVGTQGVISSQNTAKAIGDSVNRQQGHLSPIFPRQWDASNNDVQTPPKTDKLFKSQPRSSGYDGNSEPMYYSSVNPTGRIHVLPNATNGQTV